MSNQVETFFKLLFGPQAEGYICLATLAPTEMTVQKKVFKEFFFKYPNELPEMSALVDQYKDTHNMYFCPNTLRSKQRLKSTVAYCTNAWADLDTCTPEQLRVPPSVIVETSEGRYQAYWVLEDRTAPAEAESVSRRIAYYHIYHGADRSGWDLTQMLRIPGTYNLKYSLDEPQIVKILDINRNKYKLSDFKAYPQIIRGAEELTDMPEKLPDVTAEDVLDKYVMQLPAHVDTLFRTKPDGTWSQPLFSLEMSCFEAGMSLAEVFIVAEASACNKFLRDGLSKKMLWLDVQRAQLRFKENIKLLAPAADIPQAALLTESERNKIAGYKSFVHDYIVWASSLGDAAVQYHQAGAFVILSALLSGSVRLPTSFGTIKPNLWFMLLADTTLTRKTTAMDIAMDLLEEVDSSVILATDGSIEGLMTGLSTRPGHPSIFLRDEFSGLLEAFSRKDYYAGMAEMLTKLYDGKMQKRVLKKEIIEVKDPVLVLFTGGIKNKVCGLLTHEYISSGFIPRFVFITAESDVDNVRPLGPPSAKDTTGRDQILSRMRRMQSFYNVEPTLIMRDGKFVMQNPDHVDAELTPEAWSRYNQLEADMMRSALAANNPEIMTPTYDRLSKSGLKAAVLLAASNAEPDREETIVVELRDMLQAIEFVQMWRSYTNEIVERVGLTRDERLYDNILNLIARHPGSTRGHIMQHYRLNARSIELALQTLEQRGQITRLKQGKGERLFPAATHTKKVTIND